MDHQQVAEFQFVGQDIGWLLSHWAEHTPDQPLLIWAPQHGPGRRWTYREFLDDVRRVAAGLHARGVGVDDKVLIHSDNCPEMLLAWYACAVLGAVGVTTNTRSVTAELAYFIDKAGCVAAITQPQYAAVVRAAGPQLGWVAVTDDNSGEPAPTDQSAHGEDSFAGLFADPAGCPSRPAEPLRPVGILFTSGTTSKPKAVVHTHANALWAARVGPRNVDLDSESRYLVCLPFFHVNAQSWSMWSVLGVGGTIVLQPKWSVTRFWDVVVEHDVTHMSLLPFMFSTLTAPDRPVSNLRAAVFGLLVPELDAALGIRIYAAYGMTETVTHAITGRPQDGGPARSMGHPCPGYEIVVVDPETGTLCGLDQVGELWLRGTRGIQLFLEYFDDPAANAASFVHGGWFRTGDMVRVAAGGNVFYSERDSDLIKVGGENVSAREVEDVCRTVPGVADVAVVGKAHDRLGQVVVAYVVPAAGTGPLDGAVVEACAAVLADFKVPCAVYLVADFPRATLDKVAKNQLRAIADAQPSVDPAPRRGAPARSPRPD